MTRNQVVAAVIGVVVLLALGWIGPMAAGTVTGTLRDVIRQATVAGHVVDFRQGVIDAVHVVYFVVLAGLALFVTVKVLESRRWR